MQKPGEEIDQVIKRNEEIQIYRHKTLEDLLEFMWGAEIEDLKESEFGGLDGNGEESSYSFEKIINNIKQQGCYGCMDSNGIYIWIGEKASVEDVIHLIAHERAHFEYPDEGTESIEDELKCEVVGLCASFAYEKTKVIMGL